MYDLNGFVITENDGVMRWNMRMSGDVVMSGLCSLIPDVIVLHTYDDISPCSLPEPQALWRRTPYYMTVSERGVTHIYVTETGCEASDEVKKEIGARVGCTLRFR